MSMQRAGRNEPCSCGSGKKFKHCHGANASSAADAAATPPPPAAVPTQHLMEVFQLYQAGNLEAARGGCARLLRASPRHPDVLHLQALLLQRDGQLAQALQSADLGLAAGAQNQSLHNTRGMILQAMGRLGDAEQAFRDAAALNARDPGSRYNLGVVLESGGRLGEAIEAYDQALALDPRMVWATIGQGTCLISLAEPAKAAVKLEQALAIDPRCALAWTHLGNARLAQSQIALAEQHYRSALAIEPGNVTALDSLSNLLRASNRSEEAAFFLREAQRIEPRIERSIRLALLLPFVYESREQMLECGRRVQTELEALVSTSQAVEQISPGLLGEGVFNLAYHAVNQRPVMQRLAQFYLKLHPELAWRAPHLDDEPPAAAGLRIGFYSAHVHDHSVARSFAALVQALALRDGFHVHLISQQDMSGPSVRRMYNDFRGEFVQIPNTYVSAREKIASLRLDVLVYLDIGMEPLSYFLAFARLARLQCVVGGHPVTTGIPAVDRYLSSALAESDDADSHYSEKLVRLPIGFFSFREPEVPAHHKGRAELGLPISGRLYLCPMMLQKLHPDFDSALARILQLDPDGHVVLFRNADFPWHEALQIRLDRCVDAPLRSRLHFHPWVADPVDFLSINAHASVILDPFHFGIGSTAIATFAVGAPLVTWPGEFLRGRVGLAYNRLLDLPECIASDPDDYVRRAVEIASNPALRADIANRIAARKHRLFDHRQVVDDMASYFGGLVRELHGAPAHRETAG